MAKNVDALGLLLISNFFGFFGIDRFYLGCTGTGLAKLLTFGGLGLWYLYDYFMIVYYILAEYKTAPICSGYTLDLKHRRIVIYYLIALLIYNILMVVAQILRQKSSPKPQNNEKESNKNE
jgi:TM2 domain-containing membrane protein YozV